MSFVLIGMHIVAKEGESMVFDLRQDYAACEVTRFLLEVLLQVSDVKWHAVFILRTMDKE